MPRRSPPFLIIAVLLIIGTAYLIINDPYGSSSPAHPTGAGETARASGSGISRPGTAESAPSQSVESHPSATRNEITIKGRAFIDADQPAVGAYIYLFFPSDKPDLISPLNPPPAHRSHVTITDGAGEFTISTERGPVIAAAHLDGYGWGFVKLTDPSPAIRLAREKPIKFHATHLAITPIVGARVTIARLPFVTDPYTWRTSCEPEALRRLLSFIERYEFTTGPDGNYTLEGASSGLYFAQGEASGYVPWEAQYLVDSAGTVILEFNKSATARGTVAEAATGQQIAGATLQMIDPIADGAPWSRRTVTNDSGQYELISPCARLLNPEMHMKITAKGYASEMKRIENFTLGTDVKINVFLARPATVAGSVVDNNRTPLERVEVRLADKASKLLAEVQFTDEAGTYTFNDAARGREYTVRAMKLGYETSSIAIKASGDPAPPIELAPSGLLKITIDGADKLALPAQGFIYFRHDAHANGERDSAWTKQQIKLAKEMELPVSPPGEYAIFLDADGFAPAPATKVMIEPGRDTPVSLALTKGAAVGGRVVRSKDKLPVPGAEIHFNLPPGFGETFGTMTDTKTTTDGAGRFTLANCYAGDVMIRAVAEYGAHGFVKVNVPPAGNADAGDIEIRRLNRIRGKVNWDAPPAQPPQACIFHGTGLLAFRNVDPDGNFEFEQVVAGDYRVSLRDRPEDATYVSEKNVKVDDGDDVLVEFDYGSATVEGAVLRGGGQASGKWSIYIRTTGSRDTVANKYSNAKGEFKLAGIRPGEYVVEAVMPGKKSKGYVMRVCELRSGVNHIDLEASGSELTFTAMNTSGEPIPKAHLYYKALGTPMKRSLYIGSTDTDGILVVNDLAERTYQFIVTAAGCATHWAGDIQVGPGRNVEIKSRLERESIINTIVVHADGTPCDHAEIEFLQAPSPLHTYRNGGTRKTSGGSARIDGLAAGKYDITIKGAEHFPSISSAVVGAESSANLNVTLLGKGNLKVSVRTASGAPIAGAAVEIATKDGSASAVEWKKRGWIRAPGGSLITNDAGELLVEGLPASDVTVSAPGAPPKQITIKPHAVSEISIMAAP